MDDGGFQSEEDELDYLSSLLEIDDKTSKDNSPPSVDSRDPLFRDAIRLPLLDKDEAGSTSTGGCVRSVCVLELADKSKDELQAELLQMKSEMDKLRRQLEYKNQVREGRTAEERETHTRADVRTSSTSDAKKRKAYDRNTTAPSAKNKLSLTLDGLHKASRNIGTKPSSKSNPQIKARELLEKRKNELTETDNGSKVVTEKYSGLRIRNPFLSKSEMDERMEGRKMVKVPRIVAKIKDGDIEGDWVTIGVIVDKLPPKDSVKGDKYSILKLSDLSSLANVVTLFLFGDAHKQHWKMSIGTVIALLNPSLKAEVKNKDQVSGIPYTLSLDHPDKLMEVGQSCDFTQCKATVKSGGRRCNNFANMKDGGYCDYHVHGAYRKMQGGRGEFQSGYGPSHAGGLAKLKKSLKNEGSYSSSSLKVVVPPSNRLFAPGAQEEATMVTSEYKEKRKDRPLVQKKGAIMVSEGSDVHKYLLQSQSVGARNLNKAFKFEEEKRIDSENSTMSASDVLKKQKDSLQFSPKLAPTRAQSDSKKKVLSPLLGRGISSGGEVDLSGGIELTHSTQKARALLYVKKNGPLSKMDPNGPGKRELSEKKQQLIRKRVLEGSAQSVPDSGVDVESTAKKKPKFDMNSEEVQKIINAKSSHNWEAEEEEREQQQAYFEHLEKVEALEEKMRSITEIRVNVVQCQQCDYVAEGSSDLCRRENHKLMRFKALKKFFECQNCKHRTVTYNEILPSKPCRNCGCHSYQKTSMTREKKGPLLESEQLLVRGLEEKYIN